MENPLPTRLKNIKVFSTWLAPVQIVLIPVNNLNTKIISPSKEKLLKRVSSGKWFLEEKLGYKIREHQLKVPFQLVIGDNEVNDKTITYRKYGDKEQVTLKLDEYISYLCSIIKSKK